MQPTKSLGTKPNATLYHGVYELRSALANHSKRPLTSSDENIQITTNIKVYGKVHYSRHSGHVSGINKSKFMAVINTGSA